MCDLDHIAGWAPREWQSSPVFLPGKSHGQSNLAGYSPWGHRESDMTECTHNEHWTIDTFKLWCWRGPLRVPWTARRSNQSILMELNSEYSLEELMLKLKFQPFGHLTWTANFWGKNLDGEKDWGQNEKETKNMRQLFNGHELVKLSGDSEWQGSLVCCIPWCHKELDMTEWLNNICPRVGHGNLLLFLLGEFPWTENPGGLQSMWLQRVERDWLSTSLNTLPQEETGERHHIGLVSTREKQQMYWQKNIFYSSSFTCLTWLWDGWRRKSTILYLFIQS